MLPGNRDPASERRSPRDAAMIAEVLQALEGRLRAAAPPDGTEPPPTALEPELEDLIASALGELGRLSSKDHRGGIAPMLGNGVLQELLRQRRQRLVNADRDHIEGYIDERR